MQQQQQNQLDSTIDTTTKQVTDRNNKQTQKNTIYYLSRIIDAFKRYDSSAIDSLTQTIEHIKKFKYAYQQPLAKEKIQNFPRTQLKTLIFDLDETLIHCNESLFVSYDQKFQVKFPTGEMLNIGINYRPYLKESLEKLSQYYEIIVFTASHQSYADVVLDSIDKQRKYIKHRLYRDHCTLTADQMFVKDLRVLNRELSRIMLIDNAAYSYGYQPSNGIPIIPFFDDKHDSELKKLTNFLLQDEILYAYDLREYLNNYFKFNKISQFTQVRDYVQELIQ